MVLPGWACKEGGEIKNGEPQCKDGEEERAAFKHSQSLEAGDVWRMKVVEGGRVCVGIAAEGYTIWPFALTRTATCMPQLRFNEDGQWHDFAPEGGTRLKAGP